MNFNKDRNMAEEILLKNIYFVENDGQKEEEIKFYSEYLNVANYFLNNRVLFGFENKIDNGDTVEKNVIEMGFSNVGENIRIAPLENTLGKINYFKGNDPNKWNTGVQIYKRLMYLNLWDNINLSIRRIEMNLKFDWILKPTARFEDIRIKYKNVDSVSINADGSLAIKSGKNELTENIPVAYQNTNNKKVFIECNYIVYKENEEYIVGFEVGEYNKNAELIIDPMVTYSTYIGGSGNDYIQEIDVDSYGCVYITGYTDSTDFPITAGVFQTVKYGLIDAFVSKFSSDGSNLLYSTYIGGSQSDSATGITVDKFANVYLCGKTNSPDFPVTAGVFQPAYSGGDGDCFVLKFSPNAQNLIYSTYLGGSESQTPYQIIINDDGNPYVVGATDSPDFPTTPGSFQPVYAAILNASFITELSEDASSLVFSTYLSGPNSHSECLGIALDAAGNIYLTGETEGASDFPITPDAYQITNNSTNGTCYIAIMTPDGSSLIYSTYFGGSVEDIPVGISVSEDGTIYFAGTTHSNDFPVTTGAFQETKLTSYYCSFITKLQSNGREIIYSTYFGGAEGFVAAYDMNIDKQGRVYICGFTDSQTMPTTQDVRTSSFNGIYDGFVTILNQSGSNILVSYFLGGNGYDTAESIVIDGKGGVYVGGWTESSNFPTTPGAFQTTLNGTTNGFLQKAAFVFYKKAAISLDKVDYLF